MLRNDQRVDIDFPNPWVPDAEVAEIDEDAGKFLPVNRRLSSEAVQELLTTKAMSLPGPMRTWWNSSCRPQVTRQKPFSL